MKKTVSLFLFLALMAGASQPAEAQFWKKIFKKEEKKKSKPAPKKPVEKTAAAKPVKKKKEINFPETRKKTRYRVDVLVPLYLDELVKDNKPVYKGKMPDKAEPGMDFYQGVKLAADTLNMFGYNVDVFVHDITTAAGTPEAIVKSKGFDTTDMIIGAVQSAQIPMIAEFAQKHQVNFISALSPSDAGVKNNPYFTLLQPTLRSHCEAIMTAVNRKYKKREPVIFHRTSTPLDVEAYGYISEQVGDGAKRILVNTMPAKTTLSPLFDSNILNVIVMPVMDHSHAERVLQYLHNEFPAYDFEVYGMPSWKTMSSLKKADAYPNVIVYITAPFHFDPTTASGTQIANSYRQDFGGKPGEFVFRGYEVMYWYTYLLGKYGTVFNAKLGDNGSAPFTRYEIKPQWDKNDDLLYNENKHLYLYRYQGSSYMVEQ